MASSYSLRIKHSILKSFPCQEPYSTRLNRSFTRKSSFHVDSFSCRSPLIISVAIKCCINAPLHPNSFPGRSLAAVLHHDPDSFYNAVSSELNRLSDDRYFVLARANLTSATPQACLHRRIAELKEEEYEPVIQDIMYMLIYKKFLEIEVPLLPNLEKSLYNGRLEILPWNVGELEAIHSIEILETIREYLTTILGPKARSNVMVSWTPAKVEMPHLSQTYAASVLYGYFLKSASIRHCLELNFSMSYLDIIPSNKWAFLFGSGFYGIKSVSLGEFSTLRSTTLSQAQITPPNLKFYLQGLDQGTLNECSKLSKVAMDLVRMHCSALFVSEHSFSLDNEQTILTSLASLKRLMLEAIAFGSFLWESEEYIDRVFKLDK